MTLYELMTCTADVKMILKNNKNKILDDYEISCLLSHTKKIIEARIDHIRTIDEIYMFICMSFNLWDQKQYQLPEPILFRIFDEAVKRIGEFELSQLGKLSVISNTIYDKHFERIKLALNDEFEKYSDFQGLSFNSMMWVWRGLIVKYTVWPKNVNLFLKTAYIHLMSVNSSTAKFSYLAIMSEGIVESEYPIKETILTKLENFIERDSNFFGIPERQSIAYFMFQVLNSIEDIKIASDIGMKLANRFFVLHLIKGRYKKIARINRKRIFRTYLLLLEDIRVAHPIYFEITIGSLDIIFSDLKSKLIVTYLMPCFYCLVFLGFPDIFKMRNYNKKVKFAWESIMKKISAAILSGEFSDFFEISEDIEYQKNNRKIILLNYLWALAYLNIYNKEEISILVNSVRFSNIKPEDHLDFVKLYQVNAWLKKTNPNGPQISGMNKVKMEAFKKIFDSSGIKPSQTPVHNCIRRKIQSDSLDWEENYKDFQYFFDFADKKKKVAVIIDKQQTLVKNDDHLELNGVQKLADKMATADGWTVHRIISYDKDKEEDVKLDYSKIFSN